MAAAAAAWTRLLQLLSASARPLFPAGIGRTLAAVSTDQAAIFLISLPPQLQLQPPRMRRARRVEIGRRETANSDGSATFLTKLARKSDVTVKQRSARLRDGKATLSTSARRLFCSATFAQRQAFRTSLHMSSARHLIPHYLCGCRRCSSLQHTAKAVPWRAPPRAVKCSRRNTSEAVETGRRNEGRCRRSMRTERIVRTRRLPAMHALHAVCRRCSRCAGARLLRTQQIKRDREYATCENGRSEVKVRLRECFLYSLHVDVVIFDASACESALMNEAAVHTSGIPPSTPASKPQSFCPRLILK